MSHKKLFLSFVFLVTLFFILLVTFYLSIKEPKQKTQTKAEATKLEKLTQNTQQALSTYLGNKTIVNLNRLVSIAALRKQEMVSLLKTDPAQILNSRLNQSQIKELPPEVIPLAEKETLVEGVMQVLVGDDFKNKKSLTEYFIKSTSGIYRLYFYQQKANILSGARVAASGLQLDSNLLVTLVGVKGAQLQPHGQQKTAVLLIEFTNTIPQDRKIDASGAQDLVFGSNSVDAYLREVSYWDGGNPNGVYLSGDTYGYYKINEPNTGCTEKVGDTYRYQIWSQKARDLAVQDKIDLSSYQRFIYIFSKTTDCVLENKEIGGVAEVGGSQAWIVSSEMPLYVYYHEYGHLLGNSHSNKLVCSEGSLAGVCSELEYEDYWDVMGFGREYHFNAPHKLALGWLSNILETSTPGIYTIGPIESNSGIQALVIPKKNSAEKYYLEKRASIGKDTGLPEHITSGVLIHLWDSTTNSDTKLLNAYFPSEPLLDGATFQDPDSKIFITQISHSATSVTVKLSSEYTPPTCSSFKEATKCLADYNCDWYYCENTGKEICVDLGTSHDVACSVSSTIKPTKKPTRTPTMKPTRTPTKKPTKTPTPTSACVNLGGACVLASYVCDDKRILCNSCCKTNEKCTPDTAVCRKPSLTPTKKPTKTPPPQDNPPTPTNPPPQPTKTPPPCIPLWGLCGSGTSGVCCSGSSCNGTQCVPPPPTSTAPPCIPKWGYCGSGTSGVCCTGSHCNGVQCIP